MSRRRRAEAELRESEQRFRSLADSAPVFIWMSGPDRGTEFVNQAWLAFTGRTLEQELGDGWQACVHSDDLPRYLATYHAAFDEREPFHAECRVRRYDGEYRWILDRGRPRYSSLGAFLGYVGSGIDITERKRAEEAMRTFEHASRLAMIGELTAMIAHEIKQPLAAILTNVSVADMLLPSSQPHLKDLREMIEDIRRDGLRANQTIDRVRALSRKQQMVLEPVDVSRVIEDVLSLASHDAVRRGVRIEAAPASGLPAVFADRVCLQQVLLNLITNALDAMQETPAETRWLRVSATLCGTESVRVAVTDRGPGVPPEKLNTIFDSFVTTKKGGTGLGLAIARSIVESHRGTIWAENNAEGGATFYFTLSLASSVSQDPTCDSPIPEKRMQS